MDRFLQIAQNLFIRFVGFLYRIWGITRQIFGSVFGFLGRLFGFTQSTQFVEPDNAQGSEAATDRSLSVASPSNETTFAPRYVAGNAARRKSSGDMDYYRQMARQIQNSD